MKNCLVGVRTTLVYVFILGIRNNCPISVTNTLVYVCIFGTRSNCPRSVRNTLVYVLTWSLTNLVIIIVATYYCY